MKDYKTQYEEYKNTLLHETGFRRTLNETYRNSLYAEADYIDRNGVLGKVGILSAVCGFLISFLPVENGNWILASLIFLGIMGSVIWMNRITQKFKKDSAEINFYAFHYHKHFEDRIRKDKELEVRKLEETLSKTVAYMQRCVNSPNNDPAVAIEEFRRALHYVEELEKLYKHIARYDRFAGSLKDDWHFNAEIQKDIEKYF